mmetsp:Transcript_5470/g.15667  ORF Transcript_5470/g.15667 Transcript_5470/m.15667 type:complete len:541 (+) Transcript_5470:456-2078(+)
MQYQACAGPFSNMSARLPTMRAPRRNGQITSQELADFGTTTLFFLLLVALPTGSYFYLHRGLVQRYEEMSSQVREHSRQLSNLRAEVGQFATIRQRLADSVDILKEVSAQHMYAEVMARDATEKPLIDGAAWGRVGTAAGSNDGGGALGEISAAASQMANSFWAAEDWAAKKLNPLVWGSQDTQAKHAASGGGGGIGGGEGRGAGMARHSSGGGSRQYMLDDTDYDFSDPDLFEHRYKDTHAQHRAEADMLRGGKVGSAGNHQGGIGSGKGSDSGGRHDGASKVAGGGGGSNGGRNSGGKCTPNAASARGVQVPAVWNQYFKPSPVAKGLAEGFFIDVGAGDGRTFSNTWFLELVQCWKGLAIEPARTTYPQLERSRTGSTTVNGAICETAGAKRFTDVTNGGRWTGWSGFAETFDKQHTHQIEVFLKERKTWAKEVYDVKCFRLQTLLDLEKVKHVDYLAVSVEGHELQVLKSVNFSKVTVDLIEVAVHSPLERALISAYLRHQGFVEELAELWGHEGSAVFLHPDFKKGVSAAAKIGW